MIHEVKNETEKISSTQFNFEQLQVQIIELFLGYAKRTCKPCVEQIKLRFLLLSKTETQKKRKTIRD